jgi:hypothetical protein
LLILMVCPAAHGGQHAIEGDVVDRNGEPVHRAIVTLLPGNVQMVTDRDGHFIINYLRNDEGKRIRLAKRTDYVVEVFKPGFHAANKAVAYRRGLYVVEGFTLIDEAIRVEDLDDNLDPSLYTDPSHSSGATYEGQ